MLLGSLIAASPVGVLLTSWTFRELLLANRSMVSTICSLAAALTLLTLWRPFRASALVLLLLVAEPAFVQPNGDGRYYLNVPELFKEVPQHLYNLRPAYCAPTDFFYEYLRAHNYICESTQFSAPCFLIESQPNDEILARMGASILSSYLYMYSKLDFTESGASYSKILLETRRYLAVIGNSAVWRDRQFQRLRELVAGINFVFDSETVLHYKDRVLNLATLQD